MPALTKRRKTKGKSAQEAVNAAKRDAILKARMKGLTFADIGKQLGVSKQAAHKTFALAMEALAAETRGTAEQYRNLELARLDEMQAGLHANAMSGDHLAATALIKIMDRRAKLLGLDARAELDVTSGGKPLATIDDADLDARIAALESARGR